MRWLTRGASLLVFLAVLDYLVLPQIAGTRRALDLLSAVNPAWLAAGVALEAASLVSYSLLTRSVLPDNAAPFSQLLRSDLTALGVNIRVVILRLSGMAMLDATGARALGEIVNQLAERGITVLLKGASPEHTRLLGAVGTLAPVLAQGHVFSTLAAAVAHARKHIARMDHNPDHDHDHDPGSDRARTALTPAP